MKENRQRARQMENYLGSTLPREGKVQLAWYLVCKNRENSSKLQLKGLLLKLHDKYPCRLFLHGVVKPFFEPVYAFV